MKRIITVLLVIASLSATAQESVLLRLNYSKGDNYLVSIETKQNMGVQGGMNMKMDMGITVSEVDTENIKTKSKIISVAMDMKQGGMSMSYDSNKKDEELDQMGQMMKAQFDPMMKATIYTTQDWMGNIIETKIEPTIAGMEQLTNSSNTINYPKEKISIGSSWASEEENNGMKMIITYTVANIADGSVFLDVSGEVSGLGTGTVKGEATIDISTGIQKSTSMDITVSGQGTEITISTTATTLKV